MDTDTHHSYKKQSSEYVRFLGRQEEILLLKIQKWVDVFLFFD